MGTGGSIPIHMHRLYMLMARVSFSSVTRVKLCCSGRRVVEGVFGKVVCFLERSAKTEVHHGQSFLLVSGSSGERKNPASSLS